MLQCFVRAMTRTRLYKQEHEKSAFSFLECEHVAFGLDFPPLPLIQNTLFHNTSVQGKASAYSERLLNSNRNIYCSNFSKLQFFSTAHSGGAGDGNEDWHDVFERQGLNLRCYSQMMSVQSRAVLQRECQRFSFKGQSVM